MKGTIMEKCLCEGTTDEKINTQKRFEEIKALFEEHEEYVQISPLKPYYSYEDKNYYSNKWYRCSVCGCVFEFNYPDFPAQGFLKKYECHKYEL